MSTTSLKLPEEIKKLAAQAAKHQGVTPHAFMVDAIRTVAVAAEKRAGFVADALQSRDAALQSGEGYSAAEVHAYMRERASGRDPSRPRVKSWRD